MTERFYLEDDASQKEKSTSSLVKVNKSLEKMESATEKELAIEKSKFESNIRGLEQDLDELGEEGLQEELDNNESFREGFLDKMNRMKYLIGAVFLPMVAGALIRAESKLDLSTLSGQDTKETMTAAIVLALVGSALSIAKVVKENKENKQEEEEPSFD